MQFRKGHPELTVMDAVDNLSHMAELDITIPQEKTDQRTLTPEQVSEQMQALSWHDPEYHAFNRERVKETFQVILKYMKNLFEKDKGHLREEQTQRGIQAILFLAAEAAQKIDSYTQIFKSEKEAVSVTELKEYKELQHFYLTKVVQRFQKISETEENWQEAWGEGEIGDLKKAVLKDLESVRRDKDYELFLIRKEDGTPYFNRSLLRHMQLISQFDVLLADPTMEDPFLRIQMILDRDAHSAAKEILHLATPYVDAFSKDFLKFKKNSFVAAIGKAVMALMLASNSRNLMQNAVGKYALNYYTDFHYYLRQALKSAEYHKIVASPQATSERFLHSVMNLSHVLCTSFFLKAGSRKDMVAFIHMLIEKGDRGSDTQRQSSSPISLWNNLRDQDESIRYLLRQYPNGPLLKMINLFSKDNPMKGFDPIAQSNQPAQLFTISGEEFHISCIRLPCPLSQETIAKADVVEEFEGFLQSLLSQKSGGCHLLINLQDRTSWHEHARCVALEEFQTKASRAGCLRVVSLPKNGDFYDQSGPYIEWDDASEFMKLIKEQVAGGEQCGFYFPKEMDRKGLSQFVEKAIQTIHTVIFGGKERLVHQNRLDFIEIFYLMLSLRWTEEFKPDSLSFTCKDAVDAGTCASVELFAFMRMLNDPSHWSNEDKEFLLWMLYAPALLVRERAIDMQRFNRMTNALSLIAAELEAHPRETVMAFSKLYKQPFFKGCAVKAIMEI